MKQALKTLKSICILNISMCYLVAFDMLVLGGKLKLAWIVIANTTSNSPFSTDGQSNYICIGTWLIVAFLGSLIYLSIKRNWVKNKQ